MPRETTDSDMETGEKMPRETTYSDMEWGEQMPRETSSYRCGGFEVGFDSSGAITTLKDAATGTDLADAAHPLAQLRYQGMDAK